MYNEISRKNLFLVVKQYDMNNEKQLNTQQFLWHSMVVPVIVTLIGVELIL